MGEIVDLESYRKKFQRKSPRAPGAGSRRIPDGARDGNRDGESYGAPDGKGADDELPGAHRKRREPRPGDSGKIAPGGNAKAEPRKPKSD